MSSESLVGREMVNGYVTSLSHPLLFTLLPNHNFPLTTPTFKKNKLYQHIKYTQSLSSLCFFSENGISCHNFAYKSNNNKEPSVFMYGIWERKKSCIHFTLKPPTHATTFSNPLNLSTEILISFITFSFLFVLFS